MQRTLSRSEVMPLLATAQGDLIDFTVGFAKCVPPVNPVEVTLAGSGTLVCAGGVRAILTAEHVLSHLPDSGNVGLIAPTRQQGHHPPVIINMEHVRKIPIARRGADESQGPDIGLLLLSPAHWSLLPTGKPFFNLSKRRDLMLNAPHAPQRGIWVICGMVGEWTNNPPQKHRLPEQRQGFHGLCMPVLLKRERQQAVFDYVCVQVGKNEADKAPESFGGCSGGGVWHLVIYEKEDGSLVVGESLLSGVIFYEWYWEDGRATIVCHGRRSIYGKVVDTLEGFAAH
jgi:hypothetical protein